MLDKTKSATANIVQRCEDLFTDLNFEAARAWKAAKPGRKVIGFMPYYVPRELIHAAGALPLGILGGGDQLEVIHGDAYYQSYICRIPRSTIELGVSGRLDFVDGMLFPSICDVIRNLSGMWKLMFANVASRYVDLPQNFEDDVGGVFYQSELNEIREWLAHIVGKPVTDEAIRASILLFNENRRLVREAYALRAKEPWNIPSAELYVLLRAGLVLPVEDHNQLMRDYLASVRDQQRPIKDNCRVVVCGVFCEQPPLNLIKSIELSGCYIVDDDFILVTRWEKSEIATDGDPIANLAHSFLHDSLSTSAKYEPDGTKKGLYLVDSVRANKAEGVIFAMPSFCDPALLERPMLQNVLKTHGVPQIAFKYAENSGQMQPIREQAGTFADSIKLWSGA
jgi:benzoyl-CoA reductase subunit C